MNRVLFRQFWGFFVVALKSSFRNPSALFFGFFFPLVFIFSFAFFDNSATTYNLGITTSDVPSHLSYTRALENTDVFTITYGDKEDLLKKLEISNLDAVVSYNGVLEVEVTTNRSKTQNSTAVLSILSAINDKLSLQDRPTIYNIQQKSLVGRSGKYIDFVLPGILGFSIMSAAISATSFSFVSLKNSLTLKRLFATPAKSMPFIAGHSLARIVVSLSQNLLLLFLAVVFFDYNPQGGFTSLLQMLVIITFGLVVFLGLGYIVAGVSKNEDQAGPLSNIISLPQFLLAGTFFSVDSMPGWLQAIAKLLPLYNFNEAMRLVSLDGLPLWSGQVGIQIGFLSLWGIIIYLLASKLFSVKL
ncbi:MAG: ABC transporter permease [Patescibacteria group bacterium]